jgi:hypothetical protein
MSHEGFTPQHGKLGSVASWAVFILSVAYIGSAPPAAARKAGPAVRPCLWHRLHSPPDPLTSL